VERKKGGNKLQLLSQALSAAVSSLNLAKQLINEIENKGSFETPGLVGKYDGMFMVTEAGKKYPVPDNYAAKTKLVYGDKLKMVEGPEGRRFKYVGRVPFVEVEAKLALKDGRFVAVAKEGSYKLIQSAVKYHNGEEGNEVVILVPREEKHAPFAALQRVVGKEPGARPSPRATEGKENKAGEASASAKAAVSKKSAEGEGERKKKPVVRTAKREEKTAAREKKTSTKKTAKRKSTKTAVKKKTVSRKSSPAGKAGEKRIEPPGEEELR
jgi:hypothetical protein